MLNHLWHYLFQERFKANVNIILNLHAIIHVGPNYCKFVEERILYKKCILEPGIKCGPFWFMNSHVFLYIQLPL